MNNTFSGLRKVWIGEVFKRSTMQFNIPKPYTTVLNERIILTEIKIPFSGVFSPAERRAAQLQNGFNNFLKAAKIVLINATLQPIFCSLLFNRTCWVGLIYKC